MTYHILFNPNAGNGNGEASARKLDTLLAGNELHYYDMTKIASYKDFFKPIPADEPIVLAGGDGTLNRFINDTQSIAVAQDIQYYAVGSGNDFLHDLGKEKGDPPFSIKKYLVDLPTVTVKRKSYRFLNGIGYGIDGYCCEVGDRLRRTSDKPVNYTSIAIKGLLFHYKPANARITVDGKTHSFHHVWLAPTMNGRFYGGGMMVAPAQDRLNPERTVSVSVLFGSKIPGSVPPIIPSSYAAVTSASSQSVKGVLPAAFHSFPVITFRKRITILQKSFLVMGDFAFCKSASVRSPC